MTKEPTRPATGDDYYGGRHRRRAGRVQLVIEHAQPSRRPRRARVTLLTLAVVLAVSGGIAAYATPAPPVSQPAAAVTTPVDEAEQIYLRELAYAGIAVAPEQRPAAIEIAQRHVAHGHLIGMREWIMQDFRDAFPDLTEEQVDAARVVVEHHFLRVTGRKQ